MHIKTRNVNSAFTHLVSGIADGSIPTEKRQSRNGPVLQIEEPVILTYENPLERVLFNRARDVNCFFTLFESLWMLAGRNDVAPLKYYASKIGDIASNDGKIFNGAYGYRWRKAKAKHPISMSEQDCKAWHVPQGSMSEIPNDVDQIAVLIDHLKRKPESRRAVLQMWNVEDDLLKIDVTKDVCCNLSVMFSIREVQLSPNNMTTPRPFKFLDMTVTNRSNDMIWGMLGANVVHFSFLQEYVANCLGVEVGVYNQISNNLHCYVENNGGFKPDLWLAEHTFSGGKNSSRIDPEWYPQLSSIPLVQCQEKFDAEVKTFIDHDWSVAPLKDGDWEEPFLQLVADPMMRAFYMHKHRDYEAAMHWCEKIESIDWQMACENWIIKRQKMWEAKQKDE